MCLLPPPLCFAMQNIGEVSVGRRGWKIPAVEVAEVRTPLPLLVTDEIGRNARRARGLKKYPQ